MLDRHGIRENRSDNDRALRNKYEFRIDSVLLRAPIKVQCGLALKVDIVTNLEKWKRYSLKRVEACLLPFLFFALARRGRQDERLHSMLVFFLEPRQIASGRSKREARLYRLHLTRTRQNEFKWLHSGHSAHGHVISVGESIQNEVPVVLVSAQVVTRCKDDELIEPLNLTVALRVVRIRKKIDTRSVLHTV